MKLEAYIEGIGLLGPGLADWPNGREVLCARQAYQPGTTILPIPSLMPAAERRRSGSLVKLTLATGLEAIAAAQLEPTDLPTVFSSSGCDGENCHFICETLASDNRQVSPIRFHSSVHNAASGFWSIATGSMTTASVLCAFDASFGAGLLEALAQVVVDDTRVLLLACDTPHREPLFSLRPIPEALGIALVLAPRRSALTLAHITVDLTDASADQLEDPMLESLRTAIPAARGLPLLRSIALAQAQNVVLDYLDSARLAVDVAPC